MSELFWPSILLLAAILLLILEAFIPSGGLLSVLAGIGFAASIGAAFVTGGIQLGTAFMAGTTVALFVLLWMFIKWWPRSPLGRRILIRPPDEQEILPQKRTQLQQLVGQQGIAVTAMLPSGAIRVDGRTIDAVSEGMSIEKGAPVEVVAVRGNHLVVRPATAKPPAGDRSPAPAGDTIIPDPFDDSIS
jgi:membrane-bound ClpP family serine protease